MTAPLLRLHGGGRALEDLRDLQGEVSLRRLFKLRHLPASCTVGDWLRRMGKDGRGLEGLGRVNGQEGWNRVPLDVEGTIIESGFAEGEGGAQWTYKKVKGYQPLVGFVQESEAEKEEGEVRVRGPVIEEEFRDGNVPSGAAAAAFLERCRARMPAGRRLEAVRLDSAWYQAAAFNWCREWGLRLVVCADQDVAVKEAIRSIGEGEWRPYRGDREIAETVHTMDETEEAFCLVVVRWPKLQPELFDPEPYFYNVLATNGEEPAEEVVGFYDQRGEVENWIKELKDGFGMEWMPCGEMPRVLPPGGDGQGPVPGDEAAEFTQRVASAGRPDGPLAAVPDSETGGVGGASGGADVSHHGGEDVGAVGGQEKDAANGRDLRRPVQ